MPGSSPHTPPALGRTSLIVVAALAALAGALALAGSAAAQPTIEDVQSYTWNGSTQTLDSDHTWVKMEDTPGAADREIPKDGYALVSVDYTSADGASEIVFAYDQDGGDERLEYTYTINSAGDGHADVTDQSVFLGRDVNWTNPGGDGLATGSSGCEGVAEDASNFDLRNGTDEADAPGCFFLIDLREPDGGGSFSNTDYNLEVTVTDNDGSRSQVEQNDGNSDRVVKPVSSSFTFQEISFDPTVDDADSSISPQIEAGVATTINVTVDISESSDSSRSDISNNHDGDVDVWICLFEDGETEDPYTGYDDYIGDEAAQHGWDEPISCKVSERPTHPEHDDPDNPDDPEDVHSASMGAPEGPNPDNGCEADTSRWCFEETFTIDRDEVEVAPSEFIDTFDLQVIVRDPIGNFEVDRSGTQNPSPFQVAHFEVGQTPTDLGVAKDNETISVTDFLQNEGCQQFKDEPAPRDPADDRKAENGPSNPCLRALDNAPPDQAIEFPIFLENYANVRDEIRVTWEDVEGEDWNVEIEGSSETGASITETVGPASPDTSERTDSSAAGVEWKDLTSPQTQEITVRITPEPTSTADATKAGDGDRTGGFQTIDVEAESDRTQLTGNDDLEDIWSLEARLVQNAQGTIDFGENRDTSLTVTGKAQQEKTVDLTVENTGNTDGPFDVNVSQEDSPAECGPVNGNADNDQIAFELKDETGSTVDKDTILPGKTETYTLEYEPGGSVQTGAYDCVFTFNPKPETGWSPDDDVTLDPPTLDPTLTVDVKGTPDIRVWDTQGPDRDQVNVTGDEMHITVPPGTGSQDVFFFLENVGDIGLEPELDTETGWPVNDRYDLDGTWRGIDIDASGSENGTITLSQADNPFTLPISDTNETDNVLVKNLFPDGDDGRADPSVQGGGDNWVCAGEDGSASSVEERIVCRVAFRFSFDDAVAGDHVEYNFTWEDPQESEQPASVHVHLHFQHPGKVETSDVTKSVIGTDDTSTVTFEAETDAAHRFDLETSSSVDADVDADFTTDAGDDLDCSGSVTLTSDQEDERSATFRPDVTASLDASSGSCSIDASDGDIHVSAAQAGTAAINLAVEDENGTELRQVRPTFVKVANPDGDTSTDESVSQPASVTNEEIFPANTLQATGRQYVEYRFDPETGSDYPANDAEAAVLYRTDDTDAFEPYSNVDLNTEATSVGDGPDRSWTRVDANDPSTIEYQEDEDRIAADNNMTGVLLRENQNNEPVQVGSVDLIGWGDGQIEWTEGWNPLVLQVTDEEGDELEDGLSANDFELDLKFVVRNTTSDEEITDLYEFSTRDDTIVTRYLDGGYLAVDVYLPDHLTDGDLSGNLADHPMDGSATVEMEAWALHVEVQNGQSTDGQDLQGDAYWRLADLGLVGAGSSPSEPAETGTWGPSAITGVGATAFKSTVLDEDPTQDPDETERLHVATKFTNGPRDPDGTWLTGPGIHDYEIFLLHEEDRQRSSSRTVDDEETAGDVHEHTFRPYSNVEAELTIQSKARGADAPGADSIELKENGTVSGQFAEFFGLPDVETDVTYITQLDVKQDGTTILTTQVKEIVVEQNRQATSSGIPMPLAFDEPLLFSTEDTLQERRILDTRSIPGFVPDRGRFGIAAGVTSSDGGFLLELADDESTLFEVEGEGLLTINTEDLPTVGEEGRPIRLVGDRAVQPTPASAVAGVEVELTLDGTTVDSATLEETGPNEWTGRVTPDSQGDHTLTVRAFDTAGGVTVANKLVNVTADLPPEITVDVPDETDGVRAMQPGATVEATVLDNAVTTEDITYSDKVGADGDSPAVLSAENASFDSLREEETTGEYAVTVDLNQSEGRAWVNVTDIDGSAPADDEANSTIAGTDFSGGTVTGTLWFNVTGTVTLEVQTNGTDGVDETFTVNVVESSGGDGFTEVGLSGDQLTCEAGECSISYTPDGLSDGDTYQFKINASVGEDTTISGPHSVTIDDTEPTVDLEVGSPKVSGTPTVVGPSTTVTVTASDDVPADEDGGILDGLTVSGVRDGTATASTSAEPGDEVSMSQLGLETDGPGTVRANATDLALNLASASLDVQVDTSAPTIGDPDVSAGGSDVTISADIDDDAGVKQARLFHKAPDAAQFRSSPMSSDGGSTYEATVSGPGTTGTLEYYISATDRLDNQDQRRSQANPFTLDLGEIDFTNQPPEASITSPGDGETVGGTVDVTIEASDPDGDTLEVTNLAGEVIGSGNVIAVPTDGAGFTDGTATVSLDTTEFPDESVSLEATVSDGLAETTASVTIVVDNKPKAGPCPASSETVEPGEGAEVCFTYDTPENATQLDVTLVRNGEPIDEATLDPNPNGTYRASFDIPEEGSYVLQITTTMEDGSTEEVTTDTFSVQSAAGAGGEPLGRFVTTLVLGVAVVGLAAFAAFGRWG